MPTMVTLRLLSRVASILLIAVSALPLGAATTISVFDVATARTSIRIALYRPDAPRGTLIVLPGDLGVLGLQLDGLGTNLNFQVNTSARNRDAFIAAGFSVILVDTPQSMPDGMQIAYRSTAEHQADLREVLRFVRAREPLPTWVLGSSLGAISAASLAVGEPQTTPFGLILVSPYYESILQMDLEALRRPTLLLTNLQDTCFATSPTRGPELKARLITAQPLRPAVYNGGSGPEGCNAAGPHGFGGLDAEYVAEVTHWLRLTAYLVQTANYQGLWWRSPGSSENGWGVNLTHQGETLFATWFTYDTDGGAMWLVMSAGNKTAENTYSGPLYRTTGPAFSSLPFNPAQVAATQLGTATFTFTDSHNGTFAYTVNGITGSKAITKQLFGNPVPACIAGSVNGASPNYQALWWNASESGWGVNIAHQGDTLFATWFTYAAGGRGQWLVMSSGTRTAANTYTGDLYRTTGPAFNANPWGPINVARAGSGTFTFTDAENGTFAYTLDGVSQTKAITRQVYRNPVTVCR